MAWRRVGKMAEVRLPSSAYIDKPTSTMKSFAFLLPLIAAFGARIADAQTFTTLVQFTGTGGTASGYDPFGGLTLVGSGLYGMTVNGGAGGYGNVFRVGSNGSGYENLLSFTGGGGTAERL